MSLDQGRTMLAIAVNGLLEQRMGCNAGPIFLIFSLGTNMREHECCTVRPTLSINGNRDAGHGTDDVNSQVIFASQELLFTGQQPNDRSRSNVETEFATDDTSTATQHVGHEDRVSVLIEQLIYFSQKACYL